MPSAIKYLRVILSAGCALVSGAVLALDGGAFEDAEVVEFDSLAYSYTPSPFRLKQAKKLGLPVEIKTEASVALTGYLARPAGDEPRAESQTRYRIEEQLGHGAMGTVHRGTDTVLGRAVAIKVLQAHLTSDDELMTRFEQEARALARLSHPGIVQVYDFVREAEHVSIVMELVDGSDLQHWVSRACEFTVADALRIAIELAEAVSYAHQQGVVHRDFKPANVLITGDGQPKITDFGLAKLADDGGEGEVAGTPTYMAPEQLIRGQTTIQRCQTQLLK